MMLDRIACAELAAAVSSRLFCAARRGGVAAMIAASFGASSVRAQSTYDTTAFGALRWREVGPYRGGRSVAGIGSAQRPLEFWMGTSGGGVFKTTDGGINWQPMSDKYFSGTIGAIAVDPKNPDVVWVGGGETCIRGNVSHGDGVWMTKDAGKTWSYMGLKETEQIAAVNIDPRNSDVIYVSALGPTFVANEHRGLFKTTDGGKTWNKVLFVNDSTGAIDFQFDPSNPDVLYVVFWQAGRTPWGLSSGGPGSALYKSTDAGRTWTNLTKTAKGFPPGIFGKIGVAVSPGKPNRVWALVEHDSGGVYRSDDAGATWQFMNGDRKLRQRAWYYTHIYADPRDSNMVYALNTGMYRSRDGGKTFAQSITVPHGDNHDLWIAPNDPDRMIETNDGGANVSFNAGRSWSEQDFATAQFYHVATTNEFPYKICGAQQDNSTLCGPSRKAGGIPTSDWEDAGGGESGYVTPHPTKPNVIFAGSYGGLMTRKDLNTQFQRDITVWPDNPMGYSSEDIKVRFQWTYPIVFSRHSPNVVYAAGNYLYRSTDEGESWTRVSPDLSRHDPKTMGASGGPITKDQTGVETYALIFAFDESPVTAGLLWAGTDDGYIWVSRDNGANWTNVTPKDLGDFTRVSIIEPSHYASCGAYVAANRYQLGDKHPILYKTSDCGKSWTKIASGIPETEFTRVIREDPVRRGLLYAGTERGVWVSFDDGSHWQSLQRNLPPAPVHDMTINEGDLIAATHGRGFYVMDDLSALRQLSPAIVAKAAHLFKPRDAYRIDWGGGFGGGGGGGSPRGANPPSGATVYYWVDKGNQVVTLDFLDAQSKVIKSFTSNPDSLTLADSLRGDQQRAARRDSLTKAGLSADSIQKILASPTTEGGASPDFEVLARTGSRPQRVPNKLGLNAFTWNLRYPDAVRFENLIMWAASTAGPVAPPGTYQVRMKVGGQTQTQSFVVKKDPRSTSTLADYQEQFRFLTKVRDTVSAANNAVRTVRNVRFQVDDRREKIAGKPQAAEYQQLAGQMMDKLGSEEKEIYQVRNQSSQDPLNYPIKLNNKIAALEGVASGEYRPTKQTYAAFDSLTKGLRVHLTTVKSTMDDLLPKINALLKAAGLEAIVPSTQELKKEKPIVAS
jgi:photosystem II stability/assembly factor-like uncharacterized protein